MFPQCFASSSSGAEFCRTCITEFTCAGTDIVRDHEGGVPEFQHSLYSDNTACADSEGYIINQCLTWNNFLLCSLIFSIPVNACVFPFRFVMDDKNTKLCINQRRKY
jgi:hypothetical protein